MQCKVIDSWIETVFPWRAQIQFDTIFLSHRKTWIRSSFFSLSLSSSKIANSYKLSSSQENQFDTFSFSRPKIISIPFFSLHWTTSIRYYLYTRRSIAARVQRSPLPASPKTMVMDAVHSFLLPSFDLASSLLLNFSCKRGYCCFIEQWRATN